ncbi:Methionine adenosyltransferase 2 subunit beta [Auxenochlorella protothecoides]|uniref:Methionine adenosyltransferase 2 subunit beta n=1 Tax=Auxenochlorella protothecoides TaxID=3075 RepID=A0A087SNQ9_AUXPR|nr:Methionine adenosyltransferase 2 subunit beta [Auxenochlorella protothecoides]KFM27363.1 Methionine adenosyltransferase 2 subunit beta [Auxenochlorella protothecoides]
MRTVLVTGGTGYLGQFLVRALDAAAYRVRGPPCIGAGRSENVHRRPQHPALLQVVATHHTTRPAAEKTRVEWHWVDLTSGDGLADCFSALGPELVAVVNCAAASAPAFCEQNADHAAALNVPHQLLKSLAGLAATPLLIHISTDQVYAGTGTPAAGWSEDCKPQPVNVYGATKLEAERAVQASWPKHVILRPSIIVGPPPPFPLHRPLFLQFVLSALSQQKPTTFFTDEWRCPVSVHDIVAACLRLIAEADKPRAHRLYNMGGPHRLSRAEMAEAAAAVGGWSTAAVLRQPAASVTRAAPSPQDIAMDSSLCAADLGVHATPLESVLRAVCAAAQPDP